MKISLVSDLHIDCGYQELPGGDILILAGDICEVKDFHKEYHSTRLIDARPGAYKFYDFFYKECAKYNQVLYIMGNHEHYGSRYDKTFELIKKIVPSNVTIMEDDTKIINGVLFVGTTLWTDFNRGDPIALFDAKHSMSDYRRIDYFYKDRGFYNKLFPEKVLAIHHKSKNFIKETLTTHSEMPVVVITHHAPSVLSISEQYKNQSSLNACYFSDLSDIMLDHSNIKYWVHGHTHDPSDYTIGNCRVLSNPRGYLGYEDTSKFDPNFFFEI